MDEDLSGPKVDPRVAFHELAQLVLADHSMTSVLQQVANLAKAVVPGADEVSVSLVRKDRATTVVFTGQLAMDLDERQYEGGRGPCLQAAVDSQVVHIRDMTTEARFGSWPATAAERGALSSLSTPVPLQQFASAALNIYSRRAGAFGQESRELAATFATYAGVALANMHVHESTQALAENLEAAMQSREVIDQAKGILMAQHRCSADDAFQMLVALSRASNRQLREVAQALVDTTVAPQG